jgi:UDP-N-acetylglucosamine acyltransferase
MTSILSSIHPMAVVHPKAQVGEGCEIGPYCVIGENVVLGIRCKLHSHVVIDGHTRLGQGNEVFPFASIGLKTQDLKWKGGVTRTDIGDNNTFREYVTIHSATGDGETTTVGSNNHILAYCHIAHNCLLGNRIIMSNVATLAGHVTVEDCAVVGGLAAVHQFCRIGKMSIIGGCSKVVQDVPPFMLADGNPAETRTINKVGMERNGIPDEAQIALRQAYKILFREGLTIPNALAKIEKELPPLPDVQHLINFVRTSERGISK